ncbi:MAG: hypothetical protein AB1632_07345 [Nitrospirota bacterium]
MKRAIRGLLTLTGLFLFQSLLILAGQSFSQAPVQNPLPDTGKDRGQDSSEEIRQLYSIEVRNNLLSVELVDAELGVVLNDIARKSGFKVQISSDVSGMKLSTKFNDMDMERGIIRLLTLIREKNYLIHYDSKGTLSKIEIYGGSSQGKVIYGPQAPVTPVFSRSAPVAPAATPSPVIRRNIPLPRTVSPRAAPSMNAVQQISPQHEPSDIAIDNVEDEPEEAINEEAENAVEEIPYIPAQKKPVFIPPRRR